MLARQAGPDWQLRLLAQDPDSSVRAVVAANGHAPSEAFDLLRADADVGKLGAAMQHASSPYAMTWYLAYAARDSRVEVRLAAAKNPRLPEKVVALLARDPDPRVKEAIASRLGIDGDPAWLFPVEASTTRRLAKRQKRLPVDD